MQGDRFLVDQEIWDFYDEDQNLGTITIIRQEDARTLMRVIRMKDRERYLYNA